MLQAQGAGTFSSSSSTTAIAAHLQLLQSSHKLGSICASLFQLMCSCWLILQPARGSIYSMLIYKPQLCSPPPKLLLQGCSAGSAAGRAGAAVINQLQLQLWLGGLLGRLLWLSIASQA
jgi:hypothetical protein